MLEMQRFHKGGSLTACRTITYCHCLDTVFLNKMFDGGSCLSALRHWRVGEDGLVMQQIALSVEAYNLATGAESGVNTHHALLSQRCRHKQLTQIIGKDAYGFFLGLHLAVGSKLIFY